MRLFSDYELKSVLDSNYEKLKRKIDLCENDAVMANNLDILIDNFYEEFKVEPLFIDVEEFSKRKITQQKIKKRIDPIFRSYEGREYIEVDGVEMQFFYPFMGDRELFRCQASTFSISGYYQGSDLVQNYLALTYTYALSEIKNENDKEKVFKQLDKDIGAIKKGAEYVNSDVDSFNFGLKSKINKMFLEKKNNIEHFYTISSMLEVPLKKTDYAVKHIPMQRKIVPIQKKYNNEQNYYISDAEYGFILESIKHNGSTYERTPSSYKSMQEEDLRNALLAALNGLYQGSATGEAFRNKGKTDICIEKENRAAFVAECKMWTGQGAISGAIKQLDGYLTWRDCKTALIYFVRNKGFIKVLESAKESIRQIESLRQFKELDKNEFECCLISETNPGQIVNCRVMLFNLFSE